MAKDKKPEDFRKLTFEAFEHTVRPRCHGYISYKDEYGNERRKSAHYRSIFDMYVLLRAGYSDEDWLAFSYGRTVDNTKAMLSHMRDGKEIAQSIIDIYLKDGAEGRIRLFFESNLLPILSLENRRVLKDDLFGIIERDLTLPGEDYYKLWELYKQKDEFAAFISKAYLVAILRQTMPFSVVPSRFMYENDDLLPEMATYIQLVCENGFQMAPFEEMINMLTREISEKQDMGPEYRKLQWNMISFWKTVHEFVDWEQLSDDLREKYDDIRYRAYLGELSYFIQETGVAAEKMLERYGLKSELIVNYARYGKADSWKISFINNVSDEDFKRNRREAKSR